MSYYGIDVSKHQGTIDWNKVKNSKKVSFVILRASYGKSKDIKFEEYYKGAKSVGLKVGVYLYSIATTPESAKAEAQFLCGILKGKQFEMPIYFDIEEKSQFALGKENVSELCKTFCNYMETQGYYAGIYCSTYYANTYFTNEVQKRYAMWIAQYSQRCTYREQYGMWQYGIGGDTKYDTRKQGRIDGINATVDLDECYVDYHTIIRKYGMNGLSIGDVNGDGVVDSDDAVQILQSSAHELLNGTPTHTADLNHDGKTDTDDAVEVLRESNKSML